MIKFKDRKLVKGFTLIELLVVIAVIGVLSVIILSQLNSARRKGDDATIRSTMQNAVNAAQLYYEIYNNSSWNNVCTANNGLNPFMTKLNELTAPTPAGCLGQGQSGWRVHAALKDKPGKFWCVDYTGSKKTCDSAPTGYTCPAGAPQNCI